MTMPVPGVQIVVREREILTAAAGKKTRRDSRER